MLDESVEQMVGRYLQQLKRFDMPVAFGVVFGPCVEDADYDGIDLIVVSPRFDNVIDRADVGLMWRVAGAMGGTIAPVPCGERQWHEATDSAILERARTAGEYVYVLHTPSPVQRATSPPGGGDR